MAPPSNFVSFADYLGLNEEAGNQMADRTLAQGDALRSEAEAATAARFSAAKGGRESYEASGERERKGLASYGEFMGSLNDPGKRKALMEKVYGKGAVSALDSALMRGAGGGRLDAAQDEGEAVFRRAEEAGIRNDNRAGAYEQQRTGYEQQAKDYAAAQAGKRAALAKTREVNADREDWRKWNADEYARNSPDSGSYVNRQQDFLGRGGIDPVTGKQMTFKKWKTTTEGRSQYGFGGAGTLRDASGGGDY